MMDDQHTQSQSAPKLEPVGILNASEPWTELFLEDGTKLRMRIIVTAVRKVVGQTLPNGDPLLNFDYQFIQAIERAPR